MIGAGIALPYVPCGLVGLKPKGGAYVDVVAAYDMVTTNPFATPEVYTGELRLICATVVRDRDAGWCRGQWKRSC